MLNFKLNDDGDAVDQIIANHRGATDPEWTNRNYFKTFARAEEIADMCGPDYMAVDDGEHIWPRYDVIKKPKVGDFVSRSFNGDTYPEGKIAEISPTMKKITLDNGLEFWRWKQSGQWLNVGVWTMVMGCFNERNPNL